MLKTRKPDSRVSVGTQRRETWDEGGSGRGQQQPGRVFIMGTAACSESHTSQKDKIRRKQKGTEAKERRNQGKRN
jgi:hypothetical protein